MPESDWADKPLAEAEKPEDAGTDTAPAGETIAGDSAPEDTVAPNAGESVVEAASVEETPAPAEVTEARVGFAAYDVPKAEAPPEAEPAERAAPAEEPEPEVQAAAPEDAAPPAEEPEPEVQAAAPEEEAPPAEEPEPEVQAAAPEEEAPPAEEPEPEVQAAAPEEEAPPAEESEPEVQAAAPEEEAPPAEEPEPEVQAAAPEEEAPPAEEPEPEVQAAAPEEEAPLRPPDNPNHKWFILQTYSGFELRVQRTINEKLRVEKLEHLVGEIFVPGEDVERVKNGKKRKTHVIYYPGYVLIKMELTDELWHLLMDIPRVSGFVGGNNREPRPLEEDELGAIRSQMNQGMQEAVLKDEFEVGQHVIVIDGPFANFHGNIDEVNTEKSKLRVLISILGRSTPVELDFDKVKEHPDAV